MKNFDDRPADIQLEYPAPLRFPCGPEIIDTQALWTLIPGLFVQLAAMFTPDHVARGAASRMRELGTQLQALFKAEASNFKIWLTCALKDDPEWQAEVCEDLGGEAALARWEQRHAKRLTAPEADPPKPPRGAPKHTERRDTPARPARGIKTDRRGLFRLAPVERPRSSFSHAPQAPRLGPRSVPSVFSRPGLVCLTPDDLRPRAASPSAALTANMSPPTRTQIFKIWERLHVQLMVWNYHLIMADVGLELPACREDILPP